MRKLAMLGLLLVPVVSVSAQSKATELSLKVGSIGYQSAGGTNWTSVDVGTGRGVGLQGVGLGIYLSPEIALEPSIGLSYSHSGQGGSTTLVDLGLSLPIYLDKTWGHSGVYFAPGVGLRSVSISGGSERQYSIGGEVGTKIEVADPVSLRIGVTATDWLKGGGFVSSFSLTAFFGVSVFFKK